VSRAVRGQSALLAAIVVCSGAAYEAWVRRLPDEEAAGRVGTVEARKVLLDLVAVPNVAALELRQDIAVAFYLTD
jgi:hypothetical protein